MDEHIFYDRDWFDRDIRSVIDQLKHRSFDLIVGVNRGGSLPAVCLSHALKVPATMIDYSTRDGVNIHPQSLPLYFEQLNNTYKKLLIVDDLVDTGQAMKKLIRVASAYTVPTVATLLFNKDVDLAVPHVYGTSFSRKIEKRYFDFWWEMYVKF